MSLSLHVSSSDYLTSFAFYSSLPVRYSLCLCPMSLSDLMTCPHMISTEPPDCPTDLKATEIESRSITISWSHPFSGNAPLTNYIIEYREQHMANGNRNSQHQ